VELNRQIAELLAMIEAENKEYQAQIKQQKVYERTRDILNKNLVKEGDTAQTTFDLMKIQENTIKNLNNELNGYREFAFKQRRVIEAMSADRDRYDQEAQDAQQRYYAALENVKLAELQIAEVQKQIVDQETKLKSQQNTYESVRTDRNLKSKNLIESQDKVALMQQNLRFCRTVSISSSRRSSVKTKNWSRRILLTIEFRTKSRHCAMI